jgi:hypothetical protein
MSNIRPLVDEFQCRLPVALLKVEWNDPTLFLAGSGWSLAITAPWRIVSDGRLVVGSDQAAADLVQKALLEKMVVSCELQSHHAPLDMALILEGGAVIEVFSAAYLEPWTLFLEGRGLFVASPSG